MLRTAIRSLILVALSALFVLTSEAQQTFADPTASDADTPYPLNHTFDGDLTILDAGLQNADFETAETVTDAPDNSDMEENRVEVGTPPTNADFETGDFTGWTTAGTVSVQSGGTWGYYAKLQSSGAVTSSAFTVDSAQQTFVFAAGFLSSSSVNTLNVYALTGATYSTSTLIKSFTCSYCANPTWWSAATADAVPYQGQSIKLKFTRSSGTVGLDVVRGWITFPDFTMSGDVLPVADSGDDYARLESGATITSAAFDVSSATDYVTMNLKGINSSGLSKYTVYVLSGASFATQTTIANELYAAYGWSGKHFSLEDFKGQTIKIKVKENNNDVGVDDIVAVDEVVGWDTEDQVYRSTTSGNSYARFATDDSRLTSAPLDLPDDAQQVSFRWKTNGVNTGQFYIYALHGANFGTSTQIGYESGYNQDWETLKIGINAYAGEEIKIQIERFNGAFWVDDFAIESVLPGWRVGSGGGAATGSDTYGTYVAPSESDGTVRIYSSDMDKPRGWMTYYRLEYTIGYLTNSSITAWWHGEEDTYQVFADYASPSAVHRVKYFWVSDEINGDGYLEIYGKGFRLHSVGENVALRQIREPFSQKVGLGVDTSTGAFSYSDLDLATQGRVPLALNRYYNAHSDRFGSLGFRWSHTFDTHLEFEGNGDVDVIWGSGGEEFYEEDVFGDFEPYDDRVENTLVENGNGTFTLTTKTGTDYNFTSAGRMTSIVDSNDNAITLTYDGSNRLSVVEDPDGRELTFAYDGNSRIDTVTGPDSAVVEYNFDGNGDLVEVIDPEEGVRSFEYDKHRLTEATDQEDNLIFTNSYDSVNRVTAQTDAADNTITIAYNTPAKGVTTVTDPNDNSAKFYYDRYGRTTDKMDPVGNVISYIYDSNGNLDKIVDSNFNDWEFTFDSSGDLTETEDPLGNPISITYNAQHLPTTVTDGRGYTTFMTYDSDGNVLSVRDPTRAISGTAESGTGGCSAGGTGDGEDDDSDTFVDDGCPSTLYTYDSAGKMTSKVDALGRTETYSYTDGNRTSMVDGNGKTWEWTYDDAGRVTSETNPEDETTEYVYDLFGRPILERNHLGQETTYLFDLAGHLLMVEDDLGNQTFWDYDERGLVERKIDAAENETHYTYDANRNMTSVTEPTRLAVSAAESGTSGCSADGTGDGEDDDSDTFVDDGCPSTLYTYDENNRLSTVTDGEGGTTSYTYDDGGQLLSEEDPLGRTTAYEYDDAGHLLEMTLPNEGVWLYTYDESGNLETETDPLENVTTYTYDPVNRRATVTDPLLNVTEYAYDPVGQLLEVLDAELNSTVYDYDNAGRMTSIVDPMQNERTFGYDDAGRRTSVTDPLGRVTSYAYDGAGRLESVTAPGSFTTSYDYDDVGRMTSVTRPGGGVTSYSYDPRGLQMAMTDPLRQALSTPESGSSGCGPDGTGDGEDDDSDTRIDDGCPSTKYGYDASGRRSSMTDALGRATTYEFDGAGRMVAMTDALDGTVAFGFDVAGQQTSVTNARNKTTSYTYDDLGNVESKTDPLSRVHEWVYDDSGRLIETTDARDVMVSYGYDDNGNLTSVTSTGVSVEYEYDDINRRTEMTDATGTTAWNYDAASRVTSVGSPAGLVEYTYTDASERETMTLPGSRTFTYDYGATTGRLDSITDWESRVIGFSYDSNSNRSVVDRPNGVDSTYTYDAADRLTSIVHADGGGTLQSFSYALDAVGNRTAVTHGGQTESYTLDELNRVTAVDYTSGSDVSYTYDANGNIATMTVGANTTTYTYDNADELTSDGTTTYEYDDNGNLLEAGADTFEYDYANQLTSATVNSTTTDYTYDADGVRSTKESTEYLYDRESGLPMLVDDGTNAYLHEGGALAAIDGSDDPSYLLGDALGSVRGVTDEAGDLVGTSGYNVYGEVRASSGVSTLFRYTGEQYDPETGFTFLRARYLSPALGRFMSADTVQPNAPGTQGYNVYAYAANNPTTWLDPSGHSVVLNALAMNSAYVLAHPVWYIGLFATCVGVSNAGTAPQIVGRMDAALTARTSTVAQAAGWCANTLVWSLGIPTFICALIDECRNQAVAWADDLREYGSFGPAEHEWDFPGLWNLPNSWPELPELNNLFSDGQFNKLGPGMTEKLRDQVGDIHEFKKDLGGIPASRYEFYRDSDGKIWLKQKGGGGEGVESRYKVENGEVVPDEPAEGDMP